jgi:UDP-glucose 4-epimerase
MRNEKILIIGGMGFLGKNLALSLAAKNEVIIFDKYIDTSVVKKLERIKLIKGDIRSYNFNRLFNREDISYVFHLAALVGVEKVSKRPSETINIELTGISNVLHSLKGCSVKRFIYSSSSCVYGETNSKHDSIENGRLKPLGCYGCAKLLAEEALKEYSNTMGVNYSIIRYFNVYGRFQKSKMVVPRFFEQALNNRPITIYGDGTQTRDFTYIKDAVAATIRIAEHKNSKNDIFNVGTGRENSILQLTKLIKAISKSSSPIIFAEIPKPRTYYEVRRRVCNTNKLKKILGFECKTTLKAGLRLSLPYFKNLWGGRK